MFRFSLILAVLLATLCASTAFAQTFLLDDTFDTGTAGWTITNTSTSGQQWIGSLGNYTSPSNGDIQSFNATAFLLLDADTVGGTGVTIDTYAASPQFDGTTAAGTLEFKFDVAYSIWQNETFDVEVFDGATWQNVAAYSVATAGGQGVWTPATITVDITAYKATTNQVRFHYVDPGSWGWFAAFDNVQVYYYSGPEINASYTAVNVNNNATVYVGQHTTAQFTLVLTIQNPGTATLTHNATVTGSSVNCTTGAITLAASTGPGGTSALTMPVTPLGFGVFSLQISITNNDTTGGENPFVLDFRGVSTGNTLLFYGGDWDGNDGLACGSGFGGPQDAWTYEQVDVGLGETWTITALFANFLISDVSGVTTADYEIRTGMSPGVGGTVVQSGTGIAATTARYGTSAQYTIYYEYTTFIQFGTPLTLTAGTYYIGVRPATTSAMGNSFNCTASGFNGAGNPLNNLTAFWNDAVSQYTGSTPYEQAQDYNSNNVDLSIGVSGTSVTNPAIDITTTTLPNAVEQVAYSTPVTAAEVSTSGPYTWSLTGAPGWLSISGTGLTATLSGNPPASSAGTYNFSITVLATSSETDTQAVTLTVNPPNYIDITTTTLPDATELAAYSQPVTATELGTTSPYSWGLIGAPAWLNISGTGLTATISGTPPSGSAGPYNFSVIVTATSSETDTQAVSLLVLASGALNITTTSMPNGTVNQLYLGSVTCTGGTGPYTWSVASGNLPSGLTLDGSTTAVLGFSGRPDTAGTYNFTIMVTDSVAANDSQALTIIVGTGGGGGSGGGGGGGGGGGCASDSGSTAPWLALLAVIALGGAAVRRRRA
ncbi:MAG: putative Ig domain-containing protein [Planctomycetes bacterium]|nr:putative Ig domain-containing protein [Planctomycetota bacterium]